MCVRVYVCVRARARVRVRVRERVDLVIRKSGCRLAFCVGVFLVRGCSVGIYPLGADSSLETREGRCESCLNLAATAAV
jgi:hypothetical protein